MESRVYYEGLTPVAQKEDNALHWKNHYPLDNAIPIGFPNTYPLNSDLSSGMCYLTLEQPAPGINLRVNLLKYVWESYLEGLIN